MRNLRFISFIIGLIFTFNIASHSQGFDSRDEARVVFLGDIFLGSWAADFIEKYGVDYPFRGCEEILLKADLAVGNLEGPITADGEPFPDKEFLLKMPPGCQVGLYEANIRCVNLANNHMMDYGLTGLKATFASLDSSNIRWFGAGFNRREGLEEAVFTIKNQTFAFLGFSATFPQEFWATDSSAGTAFPWHEDLVESVNRCAEEYDVLVVSFHWSEEKLEYPKDYQLDLAHLCIDMGADLVVGHHPHVVQGVESYHGVPIFYSLGNFTFASYSESALVGMAAVVDFAEGKAVSASVIPLNVHNAEVHFQPKPITGTRLNEFYKHLLNISQELNAEKMVITNTGELILQ